MSPYLPAEIWKRASPPNKYRVAIRATYRLMEIPEPTAAESFWTLPNHQFSDPLLLRNPRASSCGVCLPPLFRTLCCPPFSVRLSRSIDTFLWLSPRVREISRGDVRVRGEFLPRGEDRVVFLIFVCTTSGGEGRGELSHVSSMKEISIIM